MERVLLENSKRKYTHQSESRVAEPALIGHGGRNGEWRDVMMGDDWEEKARETNSMVARHSKT